MFPTFGLSARFRHRAAAVVAAAAAVLAATAEPSAATPPGGVEIELWNADLEIEWAVDEAPGLRVTAQLDGGTVEMSELVDERLAGEVSQFFRRSDPELDHLRLRAVLRLDPDLHLYLVGEDIDLRVAAPRSDEPRGDDRARLAEASLERLIEERRAAKRAIEGEERDDDGDDVPTGDEDENESGPETDSDAEDEHAATELWVLELVGSRLDLTGIGGGVRIDAEASDLALADSEGPLELRLRQCVAELTGHRGGLTLDGENSELRLGAASAAYIRFAWRDGDLFVDDSSGRLEGSAIDSFVRLVAWRGPLDLTGDHTLLESTNSGGGHRFQIAGENLDVRLDRWQGQLRVELHGGSLEGSVWLGSGQIQVDSGGDVAVSGLRGNYHVRLADAAVARFGSVDGRLDVQAENAELDLDTVKALLLSARDSRIGGRGIRRLAKMDVSGSELDLDLATSEGRIDFELKEGTHARIQLSQPCHVTVLDAGELFNDRLDVTGCELQTLQQSRNRYRGRDPTGRRWVDFRLRGLATNGTLEIDGS